MDEDAYRRFTILEELNPGAARSFYDGLGGWGGYSDSVDRSGFAPISRGAEAAGNRAEAVAHEWLMRVDPSKSETGEVMEEAIDFHLVTAVRSKVAKKLRAEGFTVKHRRISREEQDRLNKTRKSLSFFTSLGITQEAKDKWIEQNPQKAERLRAQIKRKDELAAQKKEEQEEKAAAKRVAEEDVAGEPVKKKKRAEE